VAGRERKQVLLRLDPAVHAAVAKWAADELRSVNAQIEVILRRALTDAGRANHQDVLRRDFAAHRFRNLAAAPAAAQGVCHGALRCFLADDVAVEFFNNLSRRHVEVAVFSGFFHIRFLYQIWVFAASAQAAVG